MKQRDLHEEFEQLAVGYALHALEPEDEEAFAAHLAQCGDCVDAVAEHERTLARLALTAPQQAPPISLGERIRAVTAEEYSPVPDVVPLASRRPPRLVQLPLSALLVGAAAVVALVLGLASWNAVLQYDLDQQQTRTEELAQAVQVLETPGTRTVPLAGEDGQVLALAVLADDEMSLVVDGLQPNPQDTVYVMWGLSDSGDVRAIGAFDVEDDGLQVLRGMPLSGVEDVQRLMVTHEHGRVPPVQTEQPVLISGSV